jgi:hypothetical protein
MYCHNSPQIGEGTSIHIYQLNDEPPAAETDEGENIVTFSHWALPSCMFVCVIVWHELTLF